jgi:hypothetical protein
MGESRTKVTHTHALIVYGNYGLLLCVRPFPPEVREKLVKEPEGV